MLRTEPPNRETVRPPEIQNLAFIINDTVADTDPSVKTVTYIDWSFEPDTRVVRFGVSEILNDCVQWHWFCKRVATVNTASGMRIM